MDKHLKPPFAKPPFALQTFPIIKEEFSGKERAHTHKQICPVTARLGGVLPTGGQWSPDRWPGVKSLCAVCHKQFRPDTWPGGPGTRPGGSVTGVTEKLFMCQIRQQVNGVARGGGQAVFNQILTRFHGIWLKSG